MSFICFSQHWNFHWKINHILLFVDSVVQITSHINLSIWMERGAFLSRDRHSSNKASRSRKHVPGYCYSSVTLAISLKNVTKQKIIFKHYLLVGWMKMRRPFSWLQAKTSCSNHQKRKKALFHHIVNCFTFCNFISILLCRTLLKCSWAIKL